MKSRNYDPAWPPAQLLFNFGDLWNQQGYAVQVRYEDGKPTGIELPGHWMIVALKDRYQQWLLCQFRPVTSDKYSCWLPCRAYDNLRQALKAADDLRPLS